MKNLVQNLISTHYKYEKSSPKLTAKLYIMQISSVPMNPLNTRSRRSVKCSFANMQTLKTERKNVRV